MSALAKEGGNDEDMAEMIASEMSSLSSQLKDIEEKLKVLLVHYSSGIMAWFFTSNFYKQISCFFCYSWYFTSYILHFSEMSLKALCDIFFIR